LARGGLNRSDLALLALAEYVYYKKNGPKWDGKYEAYINEIVKILGPSKIPSKGGVLNAPCFKPVPLVSSIIGWTEIPEEDGKIYLKTGENSFQEKGDEVIIPADGIFNQFEAELAPILNKQENIASEIQVLTTLRDTLLPKLMSGELKVNEIDC
jgi:hypothetical protein